LRGEVADEVADWPLTSSCVHLSGPRCGRPAR
jgi:hypothetical protein